MNRKLFILSLAALLVTACSSDEGQSTVDMEKNLVEIRLSSGLNMQTRAYTPTQASAIADNQLVYAWIDNADDSEKYKAWELKVDGGNLDNNVPTEAAKYYPSTATGEITVYAIHGNGLGITNGTTSYPTAAITHTVSAAQNTDSNYELSDLLYAKKSLTRSSSRQQLTFKHMLSKIEVGLKAGAGAPDLTGATIEILNTKPQASVTLAKATAANAYTASDIVADGTAAPIAMKLTAENETNGGSMTTGETTTANDIKVFGEAIIVPQTITASTTSPTPFIHVHLTSGGDLYAKLSAEKTFAPYKKYIYVVTVGLSDITLSSTITDWGNDGVNNVDAGMDE